MIRNKYIRIFLILFSVLILIEGCTLGNWKSIFRGVDHGDRVHLIDAKQRAIYSTKENSHTERTAFSKLCAEPSPDTLSAYAMSIGFDLKEKEETLSVDEAAIQFSRIATTELIREWLYRSCEAYYDKALKGDHLDGETMGKIAQEMKEIVEISQNTGQQLHNRLSTCNIKGNINTQGERIYYLPYQNSYERTEIKTNEGDKYFCTEEQAQTAGFRPDCNLSKRYIAFTKLKMEDDETVMQENISFLGSENDEQLKSYIKDFSGINENNIDEIINDIKIRGGYETVNINNTYKIKDRIWNCQEPPHGYTLGWKEINL